jgi:hypothetical protein
MVYSILFIYFVMVMVAISLITILEKYFFKFSLIDYNIWLFILAIIGVSSILLYGVYKLFWYIAY